MKPSAHHLTLRKRLSWIRALAFAVMALHGGQLVAPHLLSAVQLFADQGEETDDDELPAQDARLEVTEYTLLRSHDRLRPPCLPRVAAPKVPNARVAFSHAHAAAPPSHSVPQFRDGHAVRLLI